MKIIDINTNEVIDIILPEYPGKYWTTKKYWFEYKAVCAEWDKRYTKKLLYDTSKT